MGSSSPASAPCCGLRAAATSVRCADGSSQKARARCSREACRGRLRPGNRAFSRGGAGCISLALPAPSSGRVLLPTRRAFVMKVRLGTRALFVSALAATAGCTYFELNNFERANPNDPGGAAYACTAVDFRTDDARALAITSLRSRTEPRYASCPARDRERHRDDQAAACAHRCESYSASAGSLTVAPTASSASV